MKQDVSRILFSAAICLLLPACGGEETTEDPPKLEKPVLQPLLDVEFPDYPTADAVPLKNPSELPAMKWTLKKGTRYTYNMEQIVYIVDRAVIHTGSKKPMQSRQDFRGQILMAAPVDGKAAVKFLLWPRTGNKFDKEKTQQLDFALEESGKIHAITQKTAHMSGLQLDQLLAFPEKPLKPGESVERTIRARGIGMKMGQSGRAVIRHAGFAKIKQYPCIKLELEFDIEMTPDPKSQMEGSGRMRARIVSYFSWELGCFLRVDAATRASIRAFALIEKEGRPAYSLLETDLDSTVHIRKK